MGLSACFQSVMKASYVMKAVRRALTHNRSHILLFMHSCWYIAQSCDVHGDFFRVIHVCLAISGHLLVSMVESAKYDPTFYDHEVAVCLPNFFSLHSFMSPLCHWQGCGASSLEQNWQLPITITKASGVHTNSGG